GIDIEIISPCSRSGPLASSARRGLDQTSTRFIDRDFRYAAGFWGSNTLPSKKLSLPRDVEAGMPGAATPSFLWASFQRACRLPMMVASSFLFSALSAHCCASITAIKIAWAAFGYLSTQAARMPNDFSGCLAQISPVVTAV